MKGIKKEDVNEGGLGEQHACGVPPLRGREHPRFTDACGQKGMTNVRRSTKTCKVLFVLYYIQIIIYNYIHIIIIHVAWKLECKSLMA